MKKNILPKKIIRATTVPISLTSFCTGILKELSEKFEVVALSSPGKELDQIHKSEGVRIIPVTMERHISIIKDLKALLILIKIFYQEKPFMVHSMTPKAGLLCMVAAWITRVPRRVHTFTGLIWPTAIGKKRKILILMDKILCRCATHIIPEGEGVKNDLQNHITKKNMKVLGYGNVKGVDMNYWKITPEIIEKANIIKKELGLLPKGDEKFVFTFIFVGRIVGDKGINELIDAYYKLEEFYSNNKNGIGIRLLLVGQFEDKLDPVSPLTKQKIEQSNTIRLAGSKYGQDLLACYACSDCLVFPSYREGFPNVPIEAGAMGLPSIVTDINGSREIIIGNLYESEYKNIKICKNGIIVPSKDSNALYNSMRIIIEDNNMRQQMEKNARPMIESRFEQSFVRKCLFDFYDEII